MYPQQPYDTFEASSSYTNNNQGGPYQYYDPYGPQDSEQQQSVTLDSIDFSQDPHQSLIWNNFPTTFDYSPQPMYQSDPNSYFPSLLPIDIPQHSEHLGSPFLPTAYPPLTQVDHVYPQRSNSRDSAVPTIRVVTDPVHQLSPSVNSFNNSPASFASSAFPPTPSMSPNGNFTPSPISPRTPHTPQGISVWDIANNWPSKGRGPRIPQKSYKPHTLSDRKRYVEEVDLEEPIMFFMQHPEECGIPLRDALSGKFMRLMGRDDQMFMHRGPSVSIRLKWPGYGNWSRQIPTKDFRSPPGPITKAKLAKNIARTVERFIKEKEKLRLDSEEDEQWQVGPGHIGVDDLVLVGLQHVSKGSWQAHLRLARPLPTSLPASLSRSLPTSLPSALSPAL